MPPRLEHSLKRRGEWMIKTGAQFLAISPIVTR